MPSTDTLDFYEVSSPSRTPVRSRFVAGGLTTASFLLSLPFSLVFSVAMIASVILGFSLMGWHVAAASKAMVFSWSILPLVVGLVYFLAAWAFAESLPEYEKGTYRRFRYGRGQE